MFVPVTREAFDRIVLSHCLIPDGFRLQGEYVLTEWYQAEGDNRKNIVGRTLKSSRETIYELWNYEQ